MQTVILLPTLFDANIYFLIPGSSNSKQVLSLYSSVLTL